MDFTTLLRDIYNKHGNVVQLLAKGVADLRQELSAEVDMNELPEIHQFLNDFYLSRIGIRFLIGQHLAIHEPREVSWMVQSRNQLLYQQRSILGAYCMI